MLVEVDVVIFDWSRWFEKSEVVVEQGDHGARTKFVTHL